MQRFKLVLDNFFERFSQGEDEKQSRAWERMAREIKGTIFTLLTIFSLVALTSYVRVDTLNIFNSNLNNINNLGGIAGALISEWFLGYLGVVGYSLLIFTSFITYISFRGIRFSQALPSIIGLVLGAILAAISCFLLFNETTPATSLLQGGKIGIAVGAVLQYLLNRTGALMLVGTGFIVTLIMTTQLSLVQLWRQVFDDEDDEENEASLEDEEEDPTPVRKVHRVKKPQGTKSGKGRGRKKNSSSQKKKTTKKAKTDDEKLPPDTDLADGLDDEEAPDNLDTDGEPDEELDDDEMIFEELIPFEGKYALPSKNLIKSSGGSSKRTSRRELQKNAKILCKHLLSFNVTGEVTDISEGPVLTTYEFKPTAGIKLSKIASLQSDLGVCLGTRELRVVAPIPGKTVVGFEVPRKRQQVISLKELISKNDFFDKKLRIPIPIGKETDGTPVFGDLAAMPHLLVAGATGSGKSVFINCVVTSLLFRMTPQQLRMILIDPKMLELNIFDGLPHLLTNVIVDNKKAFSALTWAVHEMDRRYELMAQKRSKNIDSYNDKTKSPRDKLPYIVIVVDELADLMLSGGEEVEIAITRLAQKARASGLHMIIATQRPSTDVITGLIKANIPSRLSFKVPSGIDSRTILDTGGAEHLIGRGDMFMIQPATRIKRMHGAFISEDDLKRITKSIKGAKNFSPFYIDF